MKGVILAGGLGTRLRPLTLVTNKHLLPVYDKPMVLYPLETLKNSGIKEILIVCGREHGNHFMSFLGSGREFGVKLSFALQDADNGGIADALSYAEDFAGKEQIAVILGDNLFQNDFSEDIKQFKGEQGSRVFLKKVSDPSRFGVAIMKGKKIIRIEEKPRIVRTNLVTTGFYLYNPDVFAKIKKLKPSGRGEIEITDVHNEYIKEGRLSFGIVRGFWSDAGTFESLLKATLWMARRKL